MWLNEIKKKNSLYQKMKRKIVNGNDVLLKEMMSIVGEEVIEY